jgi:hypothetical protein
MSISHSVSAILDAPHNSKNIANIIQHGSHLGFIYYNQTVDSYYPSVFSYHEATQVIFKCTDATLCDTSDAYLLVKFENTDFLMRIDPRDQGIRISIFDFGFPWKQEADIEAGTIDFARYIRLLLLLCKDFTILRLQTATE